MDSAVPSGEAQRKMSGPGRPGSSANGGGDFIVTFFLLRSPNDCITLGSGEMISPLTRNAGGTPAMMCRSDALYSCAVARRLSRGVEVI